MNKTFIIAEAGVNHNGSFDVAIELIEAAVIAGADAVKFQVFDPDKLTSENTPLADYQARADHKCENQNQLLRKLQLSYEDHNRLFDFCRARGIEYLASAFDMDAFAFLEQLGVAKHKIPSGELTNVPYLRRVARTKKPIFLSTGMANLEEVKRSLVILLDAGCDKSDIVVMHCTTEYPAPPSSLNLRAIETMAATLGTTVGYSDHSLGDIASLAAVALGAKAIEKHITLDTGSEGPDHKASMTPNQFAELVKSVRELETSLGDGIKRPTPHEMSNKSVVRKSIVASRPINEGEIFSDINLSTIRPLNGIGAECYDDVLGERAIRSFKKGDLIVL